MNLEEIGMVGLVQMIVQTEIGGVAKKTSLREIMREMQVGEGE